MYLYMCTHVHSLGTIVYALIDSRAAPSTGIGISIGPIPTFPGSIGTGKVCYTSTNSVVGMLRISVIKMNLCAPAQLIFKLFS